MTKNQIIEKVNSLMEKGQEDWWDTPNQVFDGKAPRDLLETEIGMDRLETMMNQINQGYL